MASNYINDRLDKIIAIGVKDKDIYTDPLVIHNFKIIYEVIYNFIPYKFKDIALKHTVPLNTLLLNFVKSDLSFFDSVSKKDPMQLYNNFKEYFDKQISTSISQETITSNFSIIVYGAKYMLVSWLKRLLRDPIYKLNDFLYLKYISNIDKYYPELRNENIEKIAVALIKAVSYYSIVGYQYIYFDLLIYTIESIIIRSFMYVGLDINKNKIQKKILDSLSYIFISYLQSNTKLFSIDILEYASSILTNSKDKILA
jgi:hypothetical protein